MLVHCPKCDALISERSESCSECYAVFDKEQLASIAKQVTDRQTKATEELKGEFEQFRQKKKSYVKYFLINSLCIAIIPPVLTWGLGYRVLGAGALIFFLVIQAILGIIATKNGATRCPYCGYPLFKRRGLHHTCPNCGENMRKWE